MTPQRGAVLSRSLWWLLTIVVSALVVTPSPARADGWDVTFFLGKAYPTLDRRLTFPLSVPSIPGVDVTVTGTPEIDTDGGLVFGGALAWEAGVVGIEGRLDVTEVGFDLTGARYDLRATLPPFQSLIGSIVLDDGRFDANRLNLLSLNIRLRTPGSVGLVTSGGLSYLREITIDGEVPLTAQVSGIPSVQAGLQLRAAPDQSGHRFGVNAGAGLRVGGERVALMGEVRVFYFQEFELQFGVANAPDLVTQLLNSLDPIRFNPVIVNAQAGIVVKF